MRNLYSCRTAGPSFSITKFDSDLNPEVTYSCTSVECNCPAGSRPTCKHRKMLGLFISEGRVNTGAFLDWDTRQWKPPLLTKGELLQPLNEEAIAKPFESETASSAISAAPGPTEVAPPAAMSGGGIFTGEFKRRKL